MLPEPEFDTETTLNTIPHNAQLERALIGCALQSIVMFRAASEIVTPEDFYIERCRFIWNKIAKLSEQDVQADIITILDEAGDSLPWMADGIDFNFLTGCVNDSLGASYENAKQYATKIKEYSVRRGLIKTANSIAQGAFDLSAEVGKVIADSVGSLQNVAASHSQKSEITARDAASMTYDHVEGVMRNGVVPGFSTGLIDFDKLKKGFRTGQSGIVAGRPGQGKTAWMLTTITHIETRLNRPAIVFNSMEMTAKALTIRLISALTKINSEKIQDGTLTDDEHTAVNDAIGQISTWPLTIIDERNPIALYSRIAQMQQQGKCDMLFNDYIGKFEAKAESRVRQVAIASNYISKIAVQLDMPVITAAQVSRDIDTRGQDSELVLKDLKETGDIEQDADWVLFINPDSGNPGIKHCHLAKYRHGPTGRFDLLFRQTYGKFENASFRTIDTNA